MNSKMKNMENIINIGVLIVFLSSFSLLFSDFVPIIKLITIISVGLVATILSWINENVLHGNVSAKCYWFLGIISFVVSIIYIGFSEVFGEWFSFYGKGSSLVSALVALSIAVFAYLTKMRYQFNKALYVIYGALMFAFFHSLYFFNLEVLCCTVIIAVWLLLLYFFNLNYYLRRFTIFAFMGVVIFNSIFGVSENLILLLTNLFVSLTGIIYIMKTNKDYGYQVCGLVSLATSFILALVHLKGILPIDNVVILLGSVIAILDLVINLLRTIDKKGIYIAYKVITSVVLLELISVVNTSEALALLSFLILVPSFVTLLHFKEDVCEKYLLPFKIVFFIYAVLVLLLVDLLSVDIFYIVIAINLVSILAHYLVKNDAVKKEYMILSILSMILLVATSDYLSIFNYVLGLLVLCLDYYLLNRHDSSSMWSGIAYALILLYAFITVHNLDVGHIIYLILALTFGGMAYINKNDKFKFTATMYAIVYFLRIYFRAVIGDTNIIGDLLALTMLILASIVIKDVLFERESSKEAYLTVTLSMILAYLELTYLEYIYVNTLILLYAISLSLLMVIFALKDNKYKTMYIVGVISLVIEVVNILGYLGDAPVALYLLVVGMLAIIFGSIMMYRFSKLPVTERVEPKVINANNYCENCGARIMEENKFCRECGHQIKK